MKNLNVSQKIAGLLILIIFITAVTLAKLGAAGFTASQFSF